MLRCGFRDLAGVKEEKKKTVEYSEIPLQILASLTTKEV